MYPPMFCNSYGCQNHLDTIQEMVMGICSAHINLLRKEENFAGICWQCGSITLIESKTQGKDLFIKDKYIFSKGCRRCTGDERQNIEWMTIPKEDLNNKVLSNIMVSNEKSYGSYLIN